MSTPTNPRVSVIVPAYNAAATLPACLNALARQDFPGDDYEVIVVDDGSCDDTGGVAVRPGVQVLTCPHAGPASARNAGAARARGEILLFTDADCEPLPDWITQMVRPLADPGIAGVKGAYLTLQTAPVARLAQCEFEDRYDRLEAQPWIDFVDTYAAAWRTSVFRAAGGFDPAFPYPNNEDVDLSYRLAAQGYRFAFNRKAQVCHHHVERWRDYLRLKFRRGYWRTVVYRMHPGKALRDSYTPQVLKLQVLLVYATAGLALLGAWPRPAARLARVGSLGALAALLLSSLPFVRLVARRERALAPLAPVFIAARAAAFAAGIAGALVKMFAFRSRRP